MPSAQVIENKQIVIQELRDRLGRAKSVVLVDARGLPVAQDTLLRKTLRDAGVDYKVYKNTLVNFAVKDTDAEGLSTYLSGPTALAFSYDEATKAASIISKQLKDMPALEFKAGLLDGTVYDAAAVAAIADIPPREELLARLLGSFKSPMASFARVVKAIADKDGEAGAAVEAVEPVEAAVAAPPEQAPEVAEAAAETTEAAEEA